jgi:SpoIIAA-like
MIEIINDVRANVAAFLATGKIDKDDYDNVLIPALDTLVKKQGIINFMLVLDTSLDNFTMGAFAKDLSVGLKHFTRWHKMAIVSNSEAVNNFTDVFSYIAPGEAKGFIHAQMAQAKEWVAG